MPREDVCLTCELRLNRRDGGKNEWVSTTEICFQQLNAVMRFIQRLNYDVDLTETWSPVDMTIYTGLRSLPHEKLRYGDIKSTSTVFMTRCSMPI